jgi:hypothetical protein
LISAKPSCPFYDFGCSSSISFKKAYGLLKLYNVDTLIIASKQSKNAIFGDPRYRFNRTIGEYSMYYVNGGSRSYVTVPVAVPVPVDSPDFRLMSYLWFINTSRIDTYLINSKEPINKLNSSMIKNISELYSTSPVKIVSNCSINETVSSELISFSTSCPGLPHIIKIGYFPNWKVTGAAKIYEASPSFMMVIPESGNVKLTYENTFYDLLGMFFTAFGFFLLLSGKAKKFLGIFDSLFNFLARHRVLLSVSFIIIMLIYLKLGDIAGPSDELRTEIAVETGSYGICEYVGDLRDNCYTRIGIKNKDTNLCRLKVREAAQRERCLAAINQGNVKR